jgi:hypothetical protein
MRKLSATLGFSRAPVSLELVMMRSIAELRQEATDARHLASTVAASASVRDLLSYASALEADAAIWQQAFSHSQGGLFAGASGPH